MIKCKRCGNPVKERTDRIAQFCSISCANKFRIKRKEKPCEFCGKQFMPPSNHAKQKFCSLECRDNARRDSVEIPCFNCGKTVIRKRNRAERFTEFFCSRKCMGEYRSKYAPKGKEHPQYKERKEYTCDYCNTPVHRLPSRVRKYVFCDSECRLQWQRESGYTQGENSSTWLGGHQDSRGPNWKSQARSARKRDNFICQRCSITQKELSKALDVHHIKPWRKFDGDWKIANRLDNLISYCHSCHQIIEWETGSKATLGI